MKLRPPTPDIDKTKPFDGALFGRKEFADSLTRLLQKTTDSPVILVNAPWGGGKTFFAKRWQASLETAQIKTIYFDAYSADYADDPFVSFTGEIVRLIDEQFPKVEAIAQTKDAFTQAAVQVGKRALGLGGKIALAALARYGLEWADLKSLTAEKEKIADGLADIGGDLLQQKINGYAEELHAVAEFRTKLQAIAAAVKDQQNFPLTIIVDELDRCRPDFALGLLERIKHLFEVENVAFVLFVNQEQLENSIRHRFGIVGDQARTYLQKFATITVDLPKGRNSGDYVNGLSAYCRALVLHYELDDEDGDWRAAGDYLGVLSGHFRLTLREAEKAIASFALYVAAAGEAEFEKVAFLAVLKVKEPFGYEALRAGRADYERLADELRLGALCAQGEPYASLIDEIRFHLLPEADAQNLIRQEPQKYRMSDSIRVGFIPRLCNALDSFKIV